jgi:UDP:flavonoid glycosyltransferase YjiC (YdhE family)
MASVLVVAGEFESTLYPYVELARRLAAAGHRVRVSGPPRVRALVEHHRLEHVLLEPSRYDRFLEADRGTSILERVVHVRRRRELAAASTAASGFSRAARELAPDLILIDGEMHEHIIAASATGIPIALLNSFVSIWRRPGLPPPHLLVRPGVGWRGTRLAISLAWRVLRWRKRHDAWTQWARRIGCDRLSVLRRLAADAEFDLRRETDTGQWLKPFTYRRLPVLSVHALEYEFPHSPPERVRYLGPMVLDARLDREMPEQARATLDAILDARRRSPGERTLIYAGFGSAATTDVALVRRLVEAVAERPRWHLVLSLSRRIAAGELGALPDRVHAFSWVPQLEVLKHADVCVTHGGINTVDECVVTGVPMLVYCGFETDMAGNTARVVHHGLGIAGDRGRDQAPTIREHIDRLVAEPSFGENLRRLRERYQTYVEDRVAERAVASLVGTTP